MSHFDVSQVDEFERTISISYLLKSILLNIMERKLPLFAK